MSSRWLDSSDEAAWREALPAARSAFGCVEFARALETSGGPPGALLVAEAEGARAACPLSLRDLGDLPFDAAVTGGACDAASPPFTGSYVDPADADADQLAALVTELERALVERRVVAGFTHLHPFAAERRLVSEPGADREIVWVDATLDPERLWRESYTRSCRKNVKRAEREGVTVRAATEESDIAAFHRIYEQTMDRAGALESYRFPLERFLAIFRQMPASARFALAEHEGLVIAATLYLHDDEDVYSFLGGADHAHQRLRPTNAVVHETIEWARAEGKRRLILGGGYTPGDGIMRFKAGFSPQRATLELGRRVHLKADYEALTAAWREHHGPGAEPGGYFPAYRATPR